MMQPRSAPEAMAWLDAQPANLIWTTTVCLFEIRYGLELLPKGRKRTVLEKRFESVRQIGIAGRVIDFDTAAAFEAAKISARMKAAGQSVDVRDMQIAGIVAARRATLATRNTKHFIETGIEVVDPWDAARSA